MKQEEVNSSFASSKEGLEKDKAAAINSGKIQQFIPADLRQSAELVEIIKDKQRLKDVIMREVG